MNISRQRSSNLAANVKDSARPIYAWRIEGVIEVLPQQDHVKRIPVNQSHATGYP